MKKRLFILIPILILLIIILVIVFTNRNKNDNEPSMEAHRGIIYREVGNDACISFYDDDVYSLYDCDSEPTSYPFDSEWECEYFFDNSEEIITFKCVDKDDIKIKVLSWTEDEFSFLFDGKERFFKAIKEDD